MIRVSNSNSGLSYNELGQAVVSGLADSRQKRFDQLLTRASYCSSVPFLNKFVLGPRTP